MEEPCQCKRCILRRQKFIEEYQQEPVAQRRRRAELAAFVARKEIERIDKELAKIQ